MGIRRLPAVVLCLASLSAGFSQESANPGEAKTKAYALICDLAGKESKLGAALADSIRLKLRRQDGVEVIDRLSTQEMTEPMDLATPAGQVIQKMRKQWGVNLAVYGTLSRTGSDVRVELRCVDLRHGNEDQGWVRVFTDSGERWRAVLAGQIVEALLGQALWKPPEYGDEEEPEQLGKPLNENGSFDAGGKGWEPADNVSTFLEEAKRPDKQRGTILRVQTDLARDPWLAYKRDLLLGKASPENPPDIPRNTGYSSVAGLEGVHFAGDYIPASPGRRYWLTADCKGRGGAKVFVKGFRRTRHAMDSMSESRLAALGLTPQKFAQMSPKQRQDLIAKDARENPKAYMRECYRWYLNCKEAKGRWTHLAAPFPPRGGLPDNVEYLQIQIYSYWPPGEYLWDNVHLYADPRQKEPQPEEAPRTPNFRNRRDATDAEGRLPQAGAP
jgi:TolB-like protein